MTDQQIIEGIRAGEDFRKKAMEAFYKREGLHKFVKTHAFRDYNGKLSLSPSEIYLDALVVLVDKIASFDEDIRSLDAYFTQIVKNICIELSRKQSRRSLLWLSGIRLGLIFGLQESVVNNDLFDLIEPYLKKIDDACRIALLVDLPKIEDKAIEIIASLGYTSKEAFILKKSRCKKHFLTMIKDAPEFQYLYKD